MTSTLTQEQIQALLEPFTYNHLVQRREDGQLVIPHEYARARLSEIFGPLGWSEETLDLTEVTKGSNAERNGSLYVAYRAQVRLAIRNDDGTIRTSWDGAGSYGASRAARDPKSLHDLHSDCMNGALSVAFSRATKNLGAQFGLHLYSVGSGYTPFNARFYLPHPHQTPEQTPEDSGEQEGTLCPDDNYDDHGRPNDPT